MASSSLKGGDFYGAAPYRSREGLSTRPGVGSDEIQLRIDPIHGDLDDEISGLRKQVRQLRNVAQDIETEAKFQNDFVNQLEVFYLVEDKVIIFWYFSESVIKIEMDTVDITSFIPQMTLIKVQAGVKNNMRRLNRSIIKEGSNNIMHVVVFALFLFFVIYLLAKFSRR